MRLNRSIAAQLRESPPYYIATGKNGKPAVWKRNEVARDEILADDFKSREAAARWIDEQSVTIERVASAESAKSKS